MPVVSNIFIALRDCNVAGIIGQRPTNFRIGSALPLFFLSSGTAGVFDFYLKMEKYKQG